jgi:hypothetical protein
MFVLLFFSLQLLPDSFIYFRFWEREAMVAEDGPLKLPRFTPNLDYKSYEGGDLDKYYDCNKPKQVEWFTDKYGMRNRVSITDADVLVIGCSNTFGCNTDYKYTFSGLLNQQKQMKLYNCSPDYSLDYSLQINETEKPKKLKQVYLVMVARYFMPDSAFYTYPVNTITFPMVEHYLKRIRENHAGTKLQKTLFGGTEIKHCDGKPHYYKILIDTNKVQKILQQNIPMLKQKLDVYKAMGCNVKVVVIPDKETFSTDPKYAANNLTNYNAVINALGANGLQVIPVIDEFSASGLLNYYHGDGHINEQGHAIIAKKLSADMQSQMH